MELTRPQAVDLLHSKGYSRRISAKLADIALLAKSNRVFEIAMKEALEKARTKGAKDKKKRNKGGMRFWEHSGKEISGGDFKGRKLRARLHGDINDLGYDTAMAQHEYE